MKELTPQQRTWKIIPGYSGYLVSSDGKVKRLEKTRRGFHHGKEYFYRTKERILKGVMRSNGYLHVNILNDSGIPRQISIHRLVAVTFLPNPDGKPQVNHKNGKKAENNVQNLEWATAQEQSIHARDVLGIKVWHKGNRGKNTPTSRPVVQKSLSGNVIKKWECGLDAVRQGGFESSGISRACSGKIRVHRGCLWELGKT